MIIGRDTLDLRHIQGMDPRYEIVFGHSDDLHDDFFPIYADGHGISLPNTVVGSRIPKGIKQIERVFRIHETSSLRCISETYYDPNEKLCLGTILRASRWNSAFLSVAGINLFSNLHNETLASLEAHRSRPSDEKPSWDKRNDDGYVLHYDWYRDLAPYKTVHAAVEFFMECSHDRSMNDACADNRDTLAALAKSDPRLLRDLIDGSYNPVSTYLETTDPLLNTKPFRLYHEAQKHVADGSLISGNNLDAYSNTASMFLFSDYTDFEVSALIHILVENTDDLAYLNTFRENRFYDAGLIDHSDKERRHYLANLMRAALYEFIHDDEYEPEYNIAEKALLPEELLAKYERCTITVRRTFQNQASFTVQDYVNRIRYTHVFDLSLVFLCSFGMGTHTEDIPDVTDRRWRP